jgi:hypothetical protein
VHEGITSQCSLQASFDQPGSLTQCLLEPGFGELHGHVNWAPVTYFGRIAFETFSADNDLDFKLFDFRTDAPGDRFLSWQPPGWPGIKPVASILSKESQSKDEYKDNLHLEFLGYELTQFLSPPNLPEAEKNLGWQMFRYENAKDRVARATELQSLIDGKTASVTGLLNLDCVHDCHAELHPILGMAARTRREECSPGAVIPPETLPGQGTLNVTCSTDGKDVRNDDAWLHRHCAISLRRAITCG